MGHTCGNCPVFGCGCTNLARLANHLGQVQGMGTQEHKKWLNWSKTGICVPQQSKEPKEFNMEECLDNLLEHEQQKHKLIIDGKGDEDRDEFGYYKCHGLNCFLVFVSDATRKRHEKNKHIEEQIGTSDVPIEQCSESNKTDSDYTFNYHNARLQFGLVLMDIVDAIKEGDGIRLTRCYKLVLLFAYKFRHTKYAYGILLYFVQINAVLSEEDSYNLTRNRFFNISGKIGTNIPLDLHMEHLNLLLKRLSKGMGGNVTTKSLQRAARSVVPLSNVIQGVYRDCSKVKKSGCHKNKDVEDALRIIINDLLQGKVFKKANGRAGYPSFPKFPSNILDIDYRDFFQWIKGHLNHWKAIYETTKT
ncbi:uncharacterized protein LOC114535442 [Dendronephthya gigantea]|uniref:uncharacterized protein LOC114535442 n=1 Tax=Dendronephthya gigantea TaxID=151771 RepID=UPI00106BE9AA|nr:uncharacterized protein LOC114535442 [Dendronephthya gigantea]